MIKYFTSFPPKYFLFNPFEKYSPFEKITSQMALFKKPLSNSFSNVTEEKKDHYTFFINSNNAISFFDSSYANSNSYILNNVFDSGITIHFEDEKNMVNNFENDIKKIETATLQVLIDIYFQNQTCNEIKSILKKCVFYSFSENQLISIWVDNFFKINKCDYSAYLEVLENDCYLNKVAIALGKKMLKKLDFKNHPMLMKFYVFLNIGNCYYYQRDLKKALLFFNKAKVYLPFNDIHNHFLFYFKITKTKKELGLDYETEKEKLICFYLSKEKWDKKLYTNDMKEYFKTAV